MMGKAAVHTVSVAAPWQPSLHKLAASAAVLFSWDSSAYQPTVRSMFRNALRDFKARPLAEGTSV